MTADLETSVAWVECPLAGLRYILLVHEMSMSVSLLAHRGTAALSVRRLLFATCNQSDSAVVGTLGDAKEK